MSTCNLSSLFPIKYPNIHSISVSGGTHTSYANGTITVGPTIGQIHLSAWAFDQPPFLQVDGYINGKPYGTQDPLYDYWLGTKLPTSVKMSSSLIQKIVGIGMGTGNPGPPWAITWIPRSGSTISIEGDIQALLNSGKFVIDNQIVKFPSLDAQAGPDNFAMWMTHIDAYGLTYSGQPFADTPLVLNANSCNAMSIDLSSPGNPWVFNCYCTGFSFSAEFPHRAAEISLELAFDPQTIPGFINIL